MKLLDRYLLKKFLRSFLFVLLLLTVLITLIDFTEKSGYYLKHNLGYGEILDYYLVYTPFIINFITPITVFITTVFVTSRLAQRTEVIAILGGGVSFLRFLAPYLLGALAITLCSFLLTGWVLAKANKARVAFESEYINGPFRQNTNKHLHIRIGPDRYFYVERYRTYNNSGVNVTLEVIRNHHLVEKLSAKRIKWHTQQGQWQLQDWRLRRFDGLHEHITQGETRYEDLSLHPHDFSINPKLHETLTLPELSVHIADLKNKGAENVRVFLAEKYVRYMAPFAAIILTFIGLLVAAVKRRGGMGKQIALGFAIAFIYIAFFLFARGVAESRGSQMLLIIWTPNIVFSLLGVALYRWLPK